MTTPTEPTPDEPTFTSPPRGSVALCFDPRTKAFTGIALALGPGNGTVFVKCDGTLAEKGSRIEDEFLVLTPESSASLLRACAHVGSGYSRSLDGGRVDVTVRVQHAIHGVYERQSYLPDGAMPDDKVPA